MHFVQSTTYQWYAIGLEELLVLIYVKSVYISHISAQRQLTEHAVQPWQKLLGAVVGVENNWDAVCGSNSADVVGTGDSTLDGSALVLVVDALSGEVCGTTLAHLEDYRRLRIAGSLETGNDGRGGSDVDGGDGVALGLGVLEEVVDIFAVDDTGPGGGDVSSARDHASGVDVTYLPLRTLEAMLIVVSGMYWVCVWVCNGGYNSVSEIVERCSMEGEVCAVLRAI